MVADAIVIFVSYVERGDLGRIALYNPSGQKKQLLNSGYHNTVKMCFVYLPDIDMARTPCRIYLLMFGVIWGSLSCEFHAKLAKYVQICYNKCLGNARGGAKALHPQAGRAVSQNE